MNHSRVTPKEFANHIMKKVEAKRTALKLTKREFSKMIAVQEPTYWRYVNGKSYPDLITLINIFKALDMNSELDALFGDTTPNPNNFEDSVFRRIQELEKGD
jgi:transcriptional regulator with XRE-family HTH domain